MSDSRQLAAILFSDIAGFTSTMEHDETRAMSQIDKYHSHPEKDIYPEFFYCRDIIKAYESNLNQ